MHCSAGYGQKIDNLLLHPRPVSRLWSLQNHAEKFATKYWSANVFGTVATVRRRSRREKGSKQFFENTHLNIREKD